MKNLSLPIAVGVAIVGCVLAVVANVTTNNIHEDLSLEQYHRIEAERGLQQARRKIAVLTKEVKEANSKIQSIQTILNQGKTKADSLKSKLDIMAQERKSLADKIKELEGQSPVPVAVPDAEVVGNP